MTYLTVPTSPLGARTVSPTRIPLSGDPPGALALLATADRVPGLVGILGAPFRPRPCDEVENVGEESVVPSEARGRPSLLPAPAPFLPTGVGVAYMGQWCLIQWYKGLLCVDICWRNVIHDLWKNLRVCCERSIMFLCASKRNSKSYHTINVDLFPPRKTAYSH